MESNHFQENSGDPHRFSDAALSRRTVLSSALLGTAAVAWPWSVAASAGVREDQRPAAGRPMEGLDIFVDPARGNDAWRGNLSTPRAGRQGPLATLAEATRRAYARAAEWNGSDRTQVNVWLRGGTYRLTEPWTLDAHGTTLQVRFMAYPGEEPIVSGAEEITGWTETTINGKTGWKASVPAGWAFTQLYVDGDRRPRPRLPKSVNDVLESDSAHVPVDDPEFFYHFQPETPRESGPEARTFAYREGDLDPDWHDISAVDVVAMYEWYDERMPIESVNPGTLECTTQFRPFDNKTWGPRYYYYVENVREALTEPGEWYRDRATSEVFYLPRPGETLGEVSVRAPRVRHLLQIEGTQADPVTGIVLSGVTFEHTTWDYSTRPEWFGQIQAAVNTVGAIVIREAQDCSFTACVVRGVGEYGFSLEPGSQRIAITHTEMTDLGAGGIRMESETQNPDVAGVRTGHNVITDNHIHGTGKVFHAGVGVLAMDTFDNTIAHNHIHNLYYSGISVGWDWTRNPTPIKDNLVEANHIYDCGRRFLSDIGGIYILGRQPRSVARNNYIHDVYEYDYGGNGLYADSYSSNVLWENNVVHDCTVGFLHNRGWDTVARNNIFAKNRYSAVKFNNPTNLPGFAAYSLDLSSNILVANNQAIASSNHAGLDYPTFLSDNNLIWNPTEADFYDPSLDQPLTLRIVRVSDGQEVPGSVAEVRLRSAAAGGDFAYAELAQPITLQANTAYRLVTTTARGGPMWYNPTAITTRADATVVGQTFYGPNVPGWRLQEDGTSFGPLDFKYRIGSGPEQNFVISTQLTALLRNETPLWVGMHFEVGDQPMTITQLGRMRPAETWWDLWTSTGREAQSLVDVDPEFEDFAGNDFDLRPTSPALAPPVDFTPIDLSGVGPR